MSNLDFFQPVSATHGPSTPVTPSARKPAGRRTTALVVALLSILAAAGVASALLLTRPASRDDRPVVLPDSFAGLPVAEATAQFGQRGTWRTQLAPVFGAHPFDGRAFGGIRPGPLVYLVVVRSDSGRKGDPAMGRAPYTRVGEVSCTHTFQLPAGLAGENRPKLYYPNRFVCWRARETLTVSVLVQKGGPGFEQKAAQALDDVWALQR